MSIRNCAPSRTEKPTTPKGHKPELLSVPESVTGKINKQFGGRNEASNQYSNHHIRRSAAWFAMRSIEANLAGALDVIPEINDTETRIAMQLAIRGMRNDLSKARAHYSSFSKPGVVRIWDMA